MSKSRKKKCSKQIQRLVTTRTKLFNCPTCQNSFTKLSKFEKHMIGSSSSCKSENSTEIFKAAIEKAGKLKIKLKSKNSEWNNTPTNTNKQHSLSEKANAVIVDHLGDEMKEAM